MRTPISSLERIAGLFVLVVIAGAAWFLASRSDEERQELRLRLRLKKTYGLAAGSAVKMNDLPIGRVAAVEMRVDRGHEDHPIVVTLHVDPAYREWILAGSSAEVSPSLIPGINTAEIFLSFAPDGDPLSDGAWLPVEPPTGLIEDYKTIPQELRAAIQPALESVEEMSGYVRKITKDIAEERGLMGSLVSDVELRREVVDLIARLDRILRGFEEAVPSIQRTASEATELVAGLKTVVDGANTTLGSVDRILATVEPETKRLSPMLDDAEVILANARRASEDVVLLTGRTKESFESRIEPLLARVVSTFDRIDRALVGLPEVLRRVDLLLVDASRITEAVKQNVLIRGSLPEPEVLRTEGGSLPRGGRRE